jgi:hypothetical protein
MLLFLDGMAHYDTSRIGMKWTEVVADGATWTVAAEGRFGNCLKRTQFGGNACGIDIAPFATRQGYWTLQKGGLCGFAVKIDDLNACVQGGYSGHFVGIFEASYCHLHLVLQPDGTFSLIREASGASVLRLADSIEGLQSGSWAYVESKWVVDDTNGLWETRLNGVPILNYTGPTASTNSGTYGLYRVWNKVRVLGGASYNNALAWRMCDFYLADLQAPNANDVSDFLGDGIVQTIMPNDVGNSAEWTTSGGPNWDMTNERPAPDDDQTYVRAATGGLRDVYNFEDIPPGATVKAVQLSTLARKETEGTAMLAPIVRQGTTDYVGPQQGVASIAYDRYLTQPYDLNPATSNKFTAAEINAGQFGFVKTV